MMNECKTTGCRMDACKITGIVLIVLAILLTLYTLNGAGIFGMFLVGALFCCHKHYSRCCSCPCCAKEDGECATECKPTKTNPPKIK